MWGTLPGQRRALIQRRFIPTCVGNIVQKEMIVREAAVHPHVCGEHELFFCQGRHIFGSSPRVWGTSESMYFDTSEDRFIPTCVGNMEYAWTYSTKSSVHPHVCGEHFFAVYYTVSSYGSSPRVWGTFSPTDYTNTAQRFIPTCVGNIR